jgi:hypothetical protein
MKVFTVVTALSLSLTSRASPQFQRRQANFTVGQIVQTNGGPVAGHAAPTAPEVSEYLGIPYAQAPVGDLRFAAPVKFAGSSLLNGSNFVGYLIIQTDSSSLTVLPLTYVVLGFYMP